MCFLLNSCNPSMQLFFEYRMEVMYRLWSWLTRFYIWPLLLSFLLYQIGLIFPLVLGFMRGLKIIDVKHVVWYTAHFIHLVNTYYWIISTFPFFKWSSSLQLLPVDLKEMLRESFGRYLFHRLVWQNLLAVQQNKLILFFLSTQLDDISQTPLQLDAPRNWVLAVSCE